MLKASGANISKVLLTQRDEENRPETDKTAVRNEKRRTQNKNKPHGARPFQLIIIIIIIIIPRETVYVMLQDLEST